MTAVEIEGITAKKEDAIQMLVQNTNAVMLAIEKNDDRALIGACVLLRQSCNDVEYRVKKVYER